jgi:hypothetical protein
MPDILNKIKRVSSNPLIEAIKNKPNALNPIGMFLSNAPTKDKVVNDVSAFNKKPMMDQAMSMVGSFGPASLGFKSEALGKPLSTMNRKQILKHGLALTDGLQDVMRDSIKLLKTGKWTSEIQMDTMLYHDAAEKLLELYKKSNKMPKDELAKMFNKIEYLTNKLK